MSFTRYLQSRASIEPPWWTTWLLGDLWHSHIFCKGNRLLYVPALNTHSLSGWEINRPQEYSCAPHLRPRPWLTLLLTRSYSRRLLRRPIFVVSTLLLGIWNTNCSPVNNTCGFHIFSFCEWMKAMNLFSTEMKQEMKHHFITVIFLRYRCPISSVISSGNTVANVYSL